MKFEEYAEKIPGILKKLRKERGLSQADVARLISIQPQTYSKYEQTSRSANTPPLAQIFALCEIYGISPNVLLGYEDTALINFTCKMYGINYRTIDRDTVEVTFPPRHKRPGEKMNVDRHLFFSVLNGLFADFGDLLDTEPYLKKYKRTEVEMFQMVLQTRLGVEMMGGMEAVLQKFEAAYKALETTMQSYYKTVEGMTEEQRKAANEQFLKAIKAQNKRKKEE